MQPVNRNSGALPCPKKTICHAKAGNAVSPSSRLFCSALIFWYLFVMMLSNSCADGLGHSGRWISRLHRLHFRYNGYIVIRNVIPRELVADAVREITAFLGADMADIATLVRRRTGTRRDCAATPCSSSLGHSATPRSLRSVRGVFSRPSAHGRYQPLYLSAANPRWVNCKLREYSLGY